jgi:hypothetical protein
MLLLCSIIVDILDDSAYLFNKKAPEREIAYDSLIHLGKLIASIEKDEVETAEDSMNDG